MATQMYAEFAIFSPNLQPEEVTALLGIKPDKSYRAGEPVSAKVSMLRKEGCWEIKTAPTKDADASLNDHLCLLLDRITPAKEAVRSLASDHSIQFGCVVYFDEQVPALYLERDVLKAMSDLNATFDIDAYLLGPDHST